MFVGGSVGNTAYREAGISDLPALVSLAGALWLESPAFRDLTFDRDVAARSFINRIVTQDGVVILAQSGESAIGFIAGKMSHYLFSDRRIAVECAWFVAPGHRKGMVGVRLAQEFMRWGKQNGAADVMISPSTGISAERTFRLLQKIGFEKQGEIYKRSI